MDGAVAAPGGGEREDRGGELFGWAGEGEERVPGGLDLQAAGGVEGGVGRGRAEGGLRVAGAGCEDGGGVEGVFEGGGFEGGFEGEGGGCREELEGVGVVGGHCGGGGYGCFCLCFECVGYNIKILLTENIKSSYDLNEKMRRCKPTAGNNSYIPHLSPHPPHP